MKNFLIVIFAIFRPMKAAQLLSIAAAGLPDIAILIFLVMFLTVLCSYVIINIERN